MAWFKRLMLALAVLFPGSAGAVDSGDLARLIEAKELVRTCDAVVIIGPSGPSQFLAALPRP